MTFLLTLLALYVLVGGFVMCLMAVASRADDQAEAFDEFERQFADKP